MARPPSEPTPQDSNPQEEALFREVDEDLRHEKMVAFWKQFGGYIVGAAVLVVAIVAGAQGWKAYQASEQAAAATEYEAAVALLTQGDTDAGLEALAGLSAEGASGYAPLASLRRAALLANEGKAEEAVQAYKLLANNGSVEPAFRNAARVLAVLRGMDLLDAAEVDGLLAEARAGTGPWRALAEELAAVSLLKRGEGAQAADLLRGLANDPQAPGNTRQRAARLLAALGEPLEMDAPVDDAAPADGQG